MDSEQIRINEATAQEIATLYRIGPKLAERIVSYRATHGYFSGPQDLAEIPGVSLELAQIIDPDIDWYIPDGGRELQERSWFTAIISALGIPIALLALSRNVSNLTSWLSGIERGGAAPRDAVGIWISISFVAFAICLLIASLAEIAASLLRNAIIAIRFGRAAIVAIWIGIFCIISAGLGNAVYYQFYAPAGWIDLFHDSAALVAIPMVMLSTVQLLPFALALVKPALAYKPLFARIYDIGVVGLAPLFVLTIWLNRTEFPIVFYPILGAIALIMILQGAGSLSGHSPYKEMIEAVTGTDQERAKRELDQKYQPSEKTSIRRTKGGILVGAGTFVLLNIAKGIFGPLIQHLVQQWLGPYIPFLS